MFYNPEVLYYHYDDDDDDVDHFLLLQAARPGVRRVALVLTDGQADRRDHVKLEDAAEQAHAAGIEVFVIGVVKRNDPLYADFASEMNTMASDPNLEHVYLIDDFMTLPSESGYNPSPPSL